MCVKLETNESCLSLKRAVWVRWKKLASDASPQLFTQSRFEYLDKWELNRRKVRKDCNL